jgi:integrase/recombinase XerD
MSEESTKTITPLRQRMIEDMRMRKLSDKTQSGYIRAVSRLARFLGRSPGTAGAEDLRRFQLHLVDVGMSPISINATITGLKFFFEATVGRAELGTKMRPLRVEHKLPVVLCWRGCKRASFWW